MEFEVLLNKFKEERTPIILNGSNHAGRILDISEDCISFERIWEDTKGKDKEKILKKEIVYIPIKDIHSVSEGEKEIPKTKTEKAIDNSLGDL